MVGVMVTSSIRTYASMLRLPGLFLSIPLTLWQATVDPCLCRRLPYTHRQVWLSLLWGQCSFLLGPGAHMVLSFPSKSLFPQCCGSFIIKSHWHSKSDPLGIPSPFCQVPRFGSLLWALELSQQRENFFGIAVLQFVDRPSSSSVVGLMATSSKRTCATCQASQHCYCQCSCPRGRPLLTHASAEGPQTLRGRSGSVSCGDHCSFPWVLVHTRFCLCPPRVSGRYEVLNVIAPLLPSCCFAFVLGCGAAFLGGSNILFLMVVQQLAVILVFSQEKMSTRPSTPPN